MQSPSPLAADADEYLSRIGVRRDVYSDGTLFVRSAVDGSRIAKLREADGTSADAAMSRSAAAFLQWRKTGLTERANLVRLIGERLRAHAGDIAQLISIETGKLLHDSLDETEHAIARCEHAISLARQIQGRAGIPEQRLQYSYDVWHPLGVTGCITAFNSPLLQFAMHALTTVMCGNTVIWKPSSKASLSAHAVHEIVQQAVRKFGSAPDGLFELLIGGRDIGKLLCDDSRVDLVNATGSIYAGRSIGLKLAQRFARSLLQLNGNNAAIVCPSAEIDKVIPFLVEAACYSSGQSSCNLRRLFVHEDVYGETVSRLKSALDCIHAGNPLQQSSVMGPLISRTAYETMQRALQEARNERARITGGERVLNEEFPLAYYVRPAIVEMEAQIGPMLRETLAPIVYVVPVSSTREAINLNNASDAGLASSIFTRDMTESHEFFAVSGNDCGMSSLNACNLRAEVGIPFGGNKASGGGRTAGSESWKSHVRRAVVTLNFASEPTIAPHILKAIASAAPGDAGFVRAPHVIKSRPPRTR